MNQAYNWKEMDSGTRSGGASFDHRGGGGMLRDGEAI